ncbi:MAG TPA: 1,4-dihydroxy-2-naphthoate polyprenyltransferase [bacterium]|nr:1,4-dihydroxy-2-naphthoate polyprenyltransferase [bacterium]
MSASASIPSSTVTPGSARAWLLAARVKTLPAAAAPVLVGSAVAHASGGFRAAPAFAALAGALLIQIGTNFANDVFDFEKGADTEARVGPVRAAQAGLLTPAAMRAGMVAAFLLATACGVYLTAVAGWPIVVIGLLSIASGIAYTGGPWPLGYHGLGDLFVMVFFGFVAVCGTVFVQSHAVPAMAVASALSVGALSTAILVVNNVRDEETDRVAGKRTLAVRLGRRAGVAEYVTLFLLAAAGAGAVAVLRASPWPLLSLATAPEAVRLVRALVRDRGAALNASLAGTARLLAVFSLLLTLGIVL